ncbi:MAG: ATP-binding protein [Phascolarctobacterium succinatutens]|uniref:sensor histidine kinase n=1 Tax=Phascolarctobacterium succinatutens TaxID=626940 RepID=UPI0023F13BFC|nr:ATP-binding protein [Phascolarctobacterium succinatutens]MDD7140670.1 ATP-binding protein [Phascolarctobacterium succinatutens]
MKQRLFRSILLLTGAAVGLVLLLFFWVSCQYITQDSFASLKREANLLTVADGEGNVPVSELQRLQLTDRVTLIAPDGHALYDNYADAKSMENHLQREEVQEALKGGEGRSRRASETLGKNILYYAVRLQDGNVLRLSRTNDAVFQQYKIILGYFVLLALAVLCGAFWAAKTITARILRPLENLNLEQPDSEAVVYPELKPIVEYFELQQEKLQKEMRRYKNKKQELKAVTNNMDEGLLFLNPVWEIESINKSAVKFFGKEKQELLGTSFFMLDDSDEIRQLLAKIEQEGKGRLVINRGSSYYQLNGSRITDKGFVLLIMDVTARTASEKIRREFSANVSHELKTPLQSVLGYSEIMLSGLVKPEDTKRFLQKINDEAHNLLRLIDDIMQLSKLDELTHDMMEEFTLQDVAQSALARLKDKACRLQVSLQLVDSTGGDSKLLGISSLMEEIFFNLLDNGLKYNHPGGEVTLRLSEGENKYTVSVADTGMGIPGSELPHIFERFYRVDRSRHKAIEGTGLGLSIVKHGVGFHGGSIRVVSTVGQGTEFIMKFPKPKYEAEK